MDVSSAVERIFNKTAMHVKAQVSNRLLKVNRVSHGPRVRSKETVKRKRDNPKDSPEEPRVSQAHTRVKHRKLVSQILKNQNRR